MGFEGIIDLDELARLEKAATPGPWNSYSAMCCPDMGGVCSEGSPYNVCKAGVGRYGHPMSIEDAEFVAYARNALPELIAELTRLRELELEKLFKQAMAQARSEAIEECACKLEDMYGNTSIAAFVRDLLKDETWFTAGCRRGRVAEREDRAEVRRRQRGDD